MTSPDKAGVVNSFCVLPEGGWSPQWAARKLGMSRDGV